MLAEATASNTDIIIRRFLLRVIRAVKPTGAGGGFLAPRRPLAAERARDVGRPLNGSPFPFGVERVTNGTRGAPERGLVFSDGWRVSPREREELS